MARSFSVVPMVWLMVCQHTVGTASAEYMAQNFLALVGCRSIIPSSRDGIDVRMRYPIFCVPLSNMPVA